MKIKADFGPIELPAGDYQVRIAVAGQDVTNINNVVYDSGTVPLPAGTDLLIGAVNNTGYGNAPVSLIVENNGEVTEIYDKDAGGSNPVISVQDINLEAGGVYTALARDVNGSEFAILGLDDLAAPITPANQDPQ